LQLLLGCSPASLEDGIKSEVSDNTKMARDILTAVFLQLETV
jgi:hypothetical protein